MFFCDWIRYPNYLGKSPHLFFFSPRILRHSLLRNPNIILLQQKRNCSTGSLPVVASLLKTQFASSSTFGCWLTDSGMMLISTMMPYGRPWRLSIREFKSESRQRLLREFTLGRGSAVSSLILQQVYFITLFYPLFRHSLAGSCSQDGFYLVSLCLDKPMTAPDL